MQMPMELLSQLIARTDFGADKRQKMPQATKTNREFGNVLNESRSAMENEKLNKDNIAAETKPTDKKTEPISREKPEKVAEEVSEENEALAAGALGYQNTIVFVLEGDKESATTPEIAIEAIGATTEDTVIDTVTTPEAEKNSVDEKPEQIVADEKPEIVKPASDAEVRVDPKEATDVNASYEVKKAIITETAEVADENDGEAGEVTARMPAIRTSEQQENPDNKENGAGFSKNGDLSPLENENDAKPVEGRKEKTYSETEKTTKEKSGEMHETVNNTVPITEGIKLERFQASQQMRQAADTPVRTENLFDEMVSRIETMHTENQQTVTIQLKPEMLGKLALEIAMDAAGLHVKISAADNEVRAMINGQITALIESLEHKGIEVVEVEVAYTGVDNGAYKDSQNNQAQSGHQKRSHRADGDDEGAAYYAVLPADVLDYYLEEELSSVEYRA